MTSQRSASFLQVLDQNQFPISRNLLMVLYAAHYFGPTFAPLLTKYTQKFLHLQNLVERENGEAIYDISIDDSYYVAYWVILLTFFRAFMMQWVFNPCAEHLCNIHSRKAKVRFAEQSWSVFYYCLSFGFGFYLYYSSPYWGNLDHIFIGWPHHRLSPMVKKYYLVSIAFWMQQVVVLNVEEKRKDHFQMFSHHVITVALVIGSYYYYFTRIGNCILMLMDLVDIFLSTAKILKYSGFSRLCDVMFILFLVSWVILRHGVYNYLCWLTYARSASLMTDSLCGLASASKRCWTPQIMNTFLYLLGGLQIITLVWMYMIAKVAYKVIMGNRAEDLRSDDEDTDVEDSQTDSADTGETSIDEKLKE